MLTSVCKTRSSSCSPAGDAPHAGERGDGVLQVGEHPHAARVGGERGVHFRGGGGGEAQDGGVVEARKVAVQVVNPSEKQTLKPGYHVSGFRFRGLNPVAFQSRVETSQSPFKG